MPDTIELQEAYAPVSIDMLDELTNRVRDDEWDALATRIHDINDEKGFWGPPEMMDKYVAKLMLVVTEVAEITEALRKGQGSRKVTEEFSDLFIRSLDLFSVLAEIGEADPGLYSVILEVVERNQARPPKHNHRWG